ncbi:MAG: FeoB-associated Cys-rich membrane protein [Gemmiger sp.]|nr:FeoB-associated Cys-rich membrane protein [Gemmiger sp.]
MLAFLTANLATIVVALVVFGAFVAVIVKMYRDHKAGKGGCSCGGSCGSCPNGGSCHTK